MEVLELVATGAPLERTLDAIIGSLEDLILGARCSILIVDPAGPTLRNGAAPNLPETYIRAIDGIRPGPRAGSCGTAAYLGEPIVAVDVRTDERWPEYRAAALDAGLVSCWSSPIFDPRGETVGTFAVYHGQSHDPSDRERRLVTRFTYLASVAIEHSRLLGDLVESEELFRRTFDDNPAGEALLDLDQRFERVNAAFAHLSGYRPAELAGRPLETVIRTVPDTDACIDSELVAQLTKCVTQQMHLQCRDGTLRPVATTISVIRSRDGLPSRLVLNVIDLTESLAAESDRRARHEAEVARQIAEDHSNAKSALLTSVSHEVRTPLQAIKGFTELLGTLDLDASRRQEALARINFAADHLLDLVTDVLDISRSEAGVLPLHVEAVGVNETVREIVHMLASAAADRDVTIEVSIDPEISVWADRGRLRQVLLNIIANAIRYGRRGGNVRIVVTPTMNEVTIEIIDDGAGIPAEYLPRMFKPFSRAEGASAPSAPVDGYGIGLMLAHGLVTAMDGAISGHNAQEGGAVFTVVLPRTSARVDSEDVAAR
ncbi:putative two-component histidine kinase [Gordonia rhizosphera NBRC 16068]|uniref:histidine kinase n=2 Tax=Gordonia rhizosphera TaxID=83341 RepID=K6X2P4_9ACTN|nr:putative two-component histidine kinase [Gordonia rhizosphera NBRC 16068]